MKNVLFVLPAVAIMCLASSVQAEDGAIDSATLSAMGLGDVQVISDSEAMEVRGMGYKGPRPRRSLALAFGISYAGIEAEGWDVSGGAGTLDGFLSYGNHYAAGEHISEAVASKEIVETKSVGGITLKMTKKYTIGVGAGGSASSIAF